MSQQLVDQRLGRSVEAPTTETEALEMVSRERFRAGVGYTLNALYGVPITFAPISTDLLVKLFKYWQQLDIWQQQPLSEHLEPPEIDWR